MSWGQPLFDGDGQPTTDTTQGIPLSELSAERQSLRQWISEIWDQPPSLANIQSRSPPPTFADDENRPYPNCYDNRFWKPAAIRIDNTYLSGYCDKVDDIIKSLPKILKDEVDLLHDLLSKLFVYELSRRICACDLLAHPWFRTDD